MKAFTRLDRKHLKALLGGKTITVSKKIHDGGELVTELKFNKKSKLNAFHRNLEKGSGVRIHQKDLDLDNCKVMNGSGFFDSIGKVFKSPITKGVVGALAPVIAPTVTMATGNPLLGAVASAGAKGYAGSGFFDTIKAIAKPLAKTVAPMAGNVVSKGITGLTGNSTLGNVAGAMTNAGLNQAGSGLKRGRPKKGSSVIGFCNMKNPVAVKGSGVTVNEAQAFTGISNANVAGNKWASASERMAYVRSHRKKSGGSMMPLG